HFLKMVSIGTVADMVPLVGENRIIVRHGLAGLAHPRNPGLQALLQGVGIGPDVNYVDIGFKLAPRINAFTRMGGGAEVIDLFGVGDPKRALAIVSEMNSRNVERRNEENAILNEIETQYDSSPESFTKQFIVTAGRDWHCGVIGNVASRLVQRFHRPALVLSIGQDKVQGSGRSIPGFHLLKALESCSDLFANFGGHAQAVGCTLKPEFASQDGVNHLAARLEKYAAAILTPDDLTPAISIDSVLPVEKLSLDFYQEVDRLGPFGVGNPVPVFSSLAVPVVGGPWVLKEQHLKFQARCNGSTLDAIWWSRGGRAAEIFTGGRLDLAYSISRDVFRGEAKLHLTIRDIRISDQQGIS
ncbi:MAG TPA: DHHA1 domain-containing protein, partial [Acidobacteriota bacterium]|nr:DHHA1 domain-containing protein [Acidobacteriota bacterium]